MSKNKYGLTLQKLLIFVLAWILTNISITEATVTGTIQPTASLIPRTCGRTFIQQGRVIGGQNAKHGAWPFIAVINYAGRFMCGGVLIGPDWVASAAHCVTGLQMRNFQVVLGDHELSSKGKEQRFSVKRLIRNPRYYIPTAFNNDIALFQLDRPAMLTNKIQPVCLPNQNEKTRVGKVCYVAGWGKTTSFGYLSNILQQASLKVISHTDCSRRNKKIAPITDRMICAANIWPQLSIKSACHGDSGGPLVCQGNDGAWELHGLVSWGSASCNTTDAFSVMARVSAFRYWIDNMINLSKKNIFNL